MKTIAGTIQKIIKEITVRKGKIIKISENTDLYPISDFGNMVSNLNQEVRLLESILDDLIEIQEKPLDTEYFRDIITNAIRLETANISSLKSIEMLEARQNKVIADKIRVMFKSQNHYKDMDSFIKCLEGWNIFCNGLATLFKRR